jgi:hypothetical protein
LNFESKYWYIVCVVERVLCIEVRRQIIIHCIVGPKGFMYWISNANIDTLYGWSKGFVYWSTKANIDTFNGWYKGFYILKYEGKYWYIVWLVQRVLCIEVRRLILIHCMVGLNGFMYKVRRQILIHCMVGPKGFIYWSTRPILLNCMVGPKDFMYWSANGNIDTL